MDLRSQLQDHLGDAFRIERELGGGGMSRVFQATEVRLSRQVVIKVLSPELAQGLNAERFEREILMAASLQQANIVPVLAAGDVDGLPYFTMPYVDGESLRNRIGRGMPIDEVVTILRDVTRALSYAHQRGIVHRDIKPDNVLLSGGTAVVTDFGIAKALSASRTDGGANATLTSVGTSIGTPAYMAPEQVAGDPNLDHRVDLYALGCMAFEMLTGKSPFSQHPPQRMLAAHLSEAPAAVESLRPDCPPALALLVARLLEKDPADRIGTATEATQALGVVATTSAESARLSPRGKLIRSLAGWAVSTLIVWIVARAAVVGIGLPDWTVPGAVVVMLLGLPVLLLTGWAKWMARKAASATPTLTPGGTPATRPSGTMANIAIRANRHLSFRRATRGGFYAMASFVVLVAAFMITRAMGIGPAASLFASGTLRNQDRILLADFAMGPGDTALAPIIQEAMRTAMSQSTAVRLLGADEVMNTLAQMQAPDGARLDGDVARQLAQRAGAKAVLGGRLVRGTDGYFLSAELTDPASGGVLASVQERARGDDELLGSVDRAAKALRGKIGESLRKVQQAVPLERATTASLPALKLYTEAVQANDVESDPLAAERKLRGALALDSSFALAWRKLAVTLVNQGKPQAAVDSALRQAYRSADRLPPVERGLVRGYYFERHSSDADRGAALDAYRDVLVVDSLHGTALSQMAFMYWRRGDHDSALAYGRRSFLRDTTNLGEAQKLVWYLQASGRDDEGLALNATLVDAPKSIGMEYFNITTEFGFGRISHQMPRIDSLVSRAGAGWRPYFIELRGTARSIGGLRAGALADYRMALEGALAIGDTAGAELEHLSAAALEVSLGNHQAGVELLRARLDNSVWRGQTMNLSHYAMAVHVLAMGGSVSEARELLARARAVWPDASRSGFAADWVELADARITLAENRPEDALRGFRAASTAMDGKQSEAYAWATFGMAQSFDAMHLPDSTIAALERYLAYPRYHRYFYGADPLFLAAAEKRLGELYDAKGDRANALRHYGTFVDQWRDADPDLRQAVITVQQRMADLQQQEGT